jgi:hypothetical protein
MLNRSRSTASVHRTKKNIPITKYKEVDKAPLIGILGSRESGKSTIARHIHARFQYQFSCPESILMKNRGLVFATIIDTMQKLIKACETYDILFETQELDDSAQRIMKANKNLDTIMSVYNEDLFEDIYQIYSLPAIQNLIEDRYKYGITVPDGGIKLLSRLKKNRPEARSGITDFLCCSQPTLDIHIPIETKTKYGIADCSGLPTIRERWTELTQHNLVLIFFVVSLSDYDIPWRDQSNRLQHALELFEQTVNSPEFRKIPFFLLFNKTDIFIEKIKFKNLTIAFPDYNGRTDYDSMVPFIRDKFLKVIKYDTPVECIFGSALSGGDIKNIVKVTDTYFNKL